MKLALSLVLLACANSPNRWVEYAPMTSHTTKARPDAIQKAIIAITDAGRDVESSDAATGIVVSKWFNADTVIGADQSRFRVRVTLETDGTYEVAALCQQKTPITKEWEECGADKRPRFLVDLVARIDSAMK